MTICHSRIRAFAEVCRRAEVLVLAAGIPGLIGADAVKPGATVTNVGIYGGANWLRGDVQFRSVAGVVGAITLVLRGVGPMVLAILLASTPTAAMVQHGIGNR